MENSKCLCKILKIIVNKSSQVYYPINKLPICLLVDVIGSKNCHLKTQKITAQKTVLSLKLRRTQTHLFDDIPPKSSPVLC